MNRGGFSWSRFLGISRMKSNISRKIGIPLSRSGREQKIGRMVTKGCLGTFLIFFFTTVVSGIILIELFFSF